MPRNPIPEFAVGIRQRYALQPWHEATLSAAVQAWQRWQAIRRKIDADGELVAGRYAKTPRAHPLLTAEVSARAAFLGALRELNLDSDA